MFHYSLDMVWEFSFSLLFHSHSEQPQDRFNVWLHILHFIWSDFLAMFFGKVPSSSILATYEIFEVIVDMDFDVVLHHF